MKWRVRPAGLAGLIAVAACRQIVGIGDEPPGAGFVPDAALDVAPEAAVQCGGFPWAPGSCDSCMHGACCTDATKCRADADCAMAFDCAARCKAGDEPCRAGCFAQGGDLMAALGSCQSASCASECGLQCGGWGLIAVPYLERVEASTSCRACLTSQPVCGQIATCMGNVSCVSNRVCIDDCLPFDFTCIGNCSYSHPIAVADGGATLVTFLTTCQAPCQLGSDWSCLGGVTWPAVTAPAITHRFQVVDLQNGSPVAMATAKACAKGDGDCSSPLTPQPFPLTDGQGFVSLSIPDQAFPFDGYIDVSKPGYVTVLQFIYPYLTESTDPPPAGQGALTTLPTTLFSMYVGATGVAWNQSLGVIFAQPFDCEGIFALGVSFSGSNLGSAARPYYLVDSFPNGKATHTVQSNIAGGGFVNVAPGLVTLVASNSGGKPVSTVTLQVRKGALTEAALVPTAGQ